MGTNDPKALVETACQDDFSQDFQRLTQVRELSLEQARNVGDRLCSAERGLAAARQRSAVLQGRLHAIESSLTWRFMNFCAQTGLLALPYALVQWWRGRRPARQIMPVSSAPEANVSNADSQTTEFNIPIADVSTAFLDMLKSSPRSFHKVFESPALMSPQERVLMYGLTFSLAPQRYLEIGTCLGGSAVLVTAAMDDLNKGLAFGVDPNPSISQQLLAAISHRFTLIRGSSPQALDRARDLAGGAFDLILVDGDHSFESTLDDLHGVLAVAASDAVILVHDAYNETVNRAIVVFLESQGGKIADGGILATTRNPIIEDNRQQDWGGLRLLRVCCGAPAAAKSQVMEESGRA
jgi:predicted O-methyltransferase YrrM